MSTFKQANRQTAPIPIPTVGVVRALPPAVVTRNAVAVRGASNFSTGPSGGGGATFKLSGWQQNQPINEWKWQNPDGTYQNAPPAQPPQPVYTPPQSTPLPAPRSIPPASNAETEGRWWLWFWVIVGAIAVLIFVSLIFWPAGGWYGEGGGHHHGEEGGGWPGKDPSQIPSPPPALDGGAGEKADDCTPDEVYNDDAKMCIMRTYFPQAVSRTIMDSSVSPCTDIYRHACGKWLDTHTNENRGFSGLSALNGVAITKIVLNKVGLCDPLL